MNGKTEPPVFAVICHSPCIVSNCNIVMYLLYHLAFRKLYLCFLTVVVIYSSCVSLRFNTRANLKSEKTERSYKCSAGLGLLLVKMLPSKNKHRWISEYKVRYHVHIRNVNKRLISVMLTVNN